MGVADTEKELAESTGRIRRPVYNPSSADSSCEKDEQIDLLLSAKKKRKNSQINENKVKKLMSEDIMKTYQLQREKEFQEISIIPPESSASDDNNNIGDKTATNETQHLDESTLSITHRAIPTIQTNQEFHGDKETEMLAQLLQKNREQAEKIKRLSQQLERNVQRDIYQQQQEEEEEQQQRRQQQLQLQEEERRRQQQQQDEEDRQQQQLQQQDEEKRQRQLQQQDEEERQRQLQQQDEEERQRQLQQQNEEEQQSQQQQPQPQQLRHEDDIRRIVEPIHVGGGFYVPSLSYREAFNSYVPSKFVKIMSHGIWGVEKLATKVVRKQKNTGDKKELTPEKKVVILYHYERFKKKRNLSKDLYDVEVGKLNKYLGTAITSARKNSNKDRP
ncbi:putative uncharacterized protein DDB_G0271606 isoform X2 [Microplitis mediator]|uniref:putative uncharacterized protein DDB_G0271606 isoform X2 n=1 Tax=Microplitis mediator TaxID=375433 RepID=UPI0025546233|nr:putative uncharacterized protein DDB_G0271606 isoform X2 [Microplitis mediator]